MIAAPQNLQSWNGYLIGVYFTGDYKLAHEVLDSIFQIIESPEAKEEDKKAKPVEICELHLFRALLHEKNGDIRKSIKYLEKKHKVIVDDVRRSQTLIRLYLSNNQA